MPPRSSSRAGDPELPDLLLQCAPGLETLLWQEARALDPDARRLGTAVLPRRNGLLYIGAEDVEPLLKSRIAEDVFVILARGPVSPGLDGLAALDALTARAKHLDAALRAHASLRGGRGSKSVSTFRVVVRSAGDRAYRRIDAQKHVATTLGRRLGKRWRAVEDTGHVEFWLTLLDAEGILALRLTGVEQRRRSKSAHMPGSLRPSVAAALVRLSAPRDDDVFLDPFCGAGTILMERGHAGRHQLLIGSDMSDAALQAATANIGAGHKPIQLNKWDARAIPLPDRSVDAIVTNPPFGIKVGTAASAKSLMPSFVDEAHRLIAPGGRLVVLTASPGALLASVREPRWAAIRTHPLEVQGRPATAITAVRV